MIKVTYAESALECSRPTEGETPTTPHSAPRSRRQKRKVGVVRENFVVKVKGDRDWQIHGSVLDHEFKVKEGGKTIVEVHKNWVTPIKDAYFIDVDYDDQALALAVVCGLENLADD